MLKLSQEQLNERIDSMPQVLKDALFSSEIAVKIGNICRFHRLNEEKIKITAELIGEVILGFSSIDDFPNNLLEDLGVDSPTISSLAEKIKQEIFQPLKKEILKNYSPVVIIEEIKKPTQPVQPVQPVQPAKPTEPEPIESEKIEIKRPEKPLIKPSQPAKPTQADKPLNPAKQKPFILFKTKKPAEPTAPKKPFLFWFKEKPAPLEEKIKAKIAGVVEETETEEKPKPAKTETPEEKTVHYQKPEAPKSPFGN